MMYTLLSRALSRRSGLLMLTSMLCACGGSETDTSSSADGRSVSSVSVTSSSAQSTASDAASSALSSAPPASSSLSSALSSELASSSLAVSSSTNSSALSSLAVSSASSAATLLAQYKATVETPVTQQQCVACHREGGPSGHTRLVFAGGTSQGDTNFIVLQNFVLDSDAGGELLLTKVRGGASHQGGAVLSGSSSEYEALEAVVLAMQGGTQSSQQKVGLFDNVGLDGYAQSLRRAALLIAGRLPTEAETASVVDEASFKQALRNLMTGNGFHQFLLRAANDRLLTDAFNQGLNLDVLEPNASFYPTLAGLFVEANQNDQRGDFYGGFYAKLRHGVAHAPLELIAYVVENERPYTEILTANYTLANPQLAQVYNADLSAFTSDDYREFRPVQNRGQIRHDNQFSAEFIEGIGSVISSHGDYVAYPHAGVLNEPAFLNRYPTTDTNRNRARARWAYYHFLGVDIEKSAARTNDPEALADTNNPTLNNPNCTVCHITMDPVAGAFQNYGDEGIYRSAWGGQDSLPGPYKRDSGLYSAGDTWYKDMLDPGFATAIAPSNTNSLQWLSQQIVADPRFSHAAVKFWWPALMAEELLKAPEAIEDEDYQDKLAAFDAQNTFVLTLATSFATGITEAGAYNLKDMLVELLASPWFRAGEAETTLSASQQSQLAGIGTGRLLTPEELEAKTQALIGYAWGETEASWRLDNRYTNLINRYLIYYGGMDSVGITARARELNTLMANVALTQATSVACGAVVMDMNRDPESAIFTRVDRYDSPVSHEADLMPVTGLDNAGASISVMDVVLPAGEQRVSVQFANPHWDGDLQEGTNLIITRLRVLGANGTEVLAINGEDFQTTDGFTVTQNENGGNTGSRFYDQALARNAGYILWSGGVSLPLTVPANGSYQVEVTAWRRNVAGYPVNMVLAVNALAPYSNALGEQRIRQQLVVMHDKFLGQVVATDSPEVDASFNLLVDTWQWRQENMPQRAYDWQTEGCDIPVPNWWQQDWTNEFADSSYMQGSWISVLIYFMTDYHYLHE